MLTKSYFVVELYTTFVLGSSYFVFFGTSIAEIFTAVLVFKKRRNHNNNKLGYSSQLNRGNYFIVIRTKYFHNVVFVTMLVLLTMMKKPKGVVDDNKKPFNFYKV